MLHSECYIVNVIFELYAFSMFSLTPAYLFEICTGLAVCFVCFEYGSSKNKGTFQYTNDIEEPDFESNMEKSMKWGIDTINMP